MEAMKTMDLRDNMHQLIYEVLGNSLDEARAGYCTRIEVALLSGCKVKIIDNGRGLPLSKDLNVSKDVLAKILSGNPITNAEYSQMGDLVQIGMQTVNSLCDFLQITIYRDCNKFHQDYIRGIAQHDMFISNAKCKSGTEIIMRPDKAIFGDMMFSKQAVCNWLEVRTVDIENLEITRIPA